MKVVSIVQVMNGKTEDELIMQRIAVSQKLRSAFMEIEVIPSLSPAADTTNGHIAIRLLAKELELISGSELVAFAPGWESSRMAVSLHQICVDHGMETVCFSDAALGGAEHGSGTAE